MRLNSNEQAHRRTKSFKRNGTEPNRCFSDTFFWPFLDLWFCSSADFHWDDLIFRFYFHYYCFCLWMLLSGLLFWAENNSEKQNNSMTKKNRLKMYHVTQSEPIHTQSHWMLATTISFFLLFLFKIVFSFRLLQQSFNLLCLSDFEKFFGVESSNAIVYCIVLHNAAALRFFALNKFSQMIDHKAQIIRWICEEFVPTEWNAGIGALF